MKPHPILLLAAAVPLLLSGCGTPSSIASNTYPDVPNGYEPKANLFSSEPIAVWGQSHSVLAIITVGSGSCPPVPTAIGSKDASTITLTFVRSPNSPCSADLGPTTHEFPIPEGIDTSTEVTVEMHFDYETDLDYSVVVED